MLIIKLLFFSSYDDGSYKHDDTGDYGPYHYWKLRKQAEAMKKKNAPAETVRAAPAPTAAPAPVLRQRRPVTAAPGPAPSRFANFQAIPTAQAAPARQPQRFTAPAPRPQPQQPQFVPRAPQQPAAPVSSDPHFAPPGGLRFQFQIEAPEFNYQNNFADNAWAFSSPLYSTNAKGGSYSYAAIY